MRLSRFSAMTMPPGDRQRTARQTGAAAARHEREFFHRGRTAPAAMTSSADSGNCHGERRRAKRGQSVALVRGKLLGLFEQALGWEQIREALESGGRHERGYCKLIEPGVRDSRRFIVAPARYRRDDLANRGRAEPRK